MGCLRWGDELRRGSLGRWGIDVRATGYAGKQQLFGYDGDGGDVLQLSRARRERDRCVCQQRGGDGDDVPGGAERVVGGGDEQHSDRSELDGQLGGGERL